MHVLCRVIIKQHVTEKKSVIGCHEYYVSHKSKIIRSLATQRDKHVSESEVCGTLHDTRDKSPELQFQSGGKS